MSTACYLRDLGSPQMAGQMLCVGRVLL